MYHLVLCLLFLHARNSRRVCIRTISEIHMIIRIITIDRGPRKATGYRTVHTTRTRWSNCTSFGQFLTNLLDGECVPIVGQIAWSIFDQLYSYSDLSIQATGVLGVHNRITAIR